MKKMNALLAILLTTVIPFTPCLLADDGAYVSQEECESCEIEETSDQCCCLKDIYSLEAFIAHIEGKGIGYRRGYSTLGFLLMPTYQEPDSLFPFIDIRGHGFDNKKLAANLGIGFRYMHHEDWVFGSNLYYDLRQGAHMGFDQVGPKFQQIGIGFEALGPCFDVRLNFYQPVGKTERHFTQTVFINNAGITPTLIPKEESAMRGFDAEIGLCIGKGYFNQCCVGWGTYFALGTYYLDDHGNDGRLGAKVRLAANLGRYYLAEVRAHYDRIERGSVQIFVGVDFPLYPFTSLDFKNSCNEKCLGPWSEHVHRAEIIPLRH